MFCGFEIGKEGDFTILRATKAKALFDFLYLRKNLLSNRKSIKELRLNLGNLDRDSLKELKIYFNLEKSKKMKEILNWLFD